MHPDFIRLIHHPLKFRLFLLKNLPSAYFSGVRVVGVNAEECRVMVPYKWFSTNPFRSTYFACLAMAAEMSTGILALGNIYQKKPGISMLVKHLEADYIKKAIGITIFTCGDGAQIAAVIEKAQASGIAQEFIAESTGKNAAGEVVAIFRITWGFKAKA